MSKYSVARYYRETNGDIYDRETGETIVVITEQQRDNEYEIRDSHYNHYTVDKDDIEEIR